MERRSLFKAFGGALSAALGVAVVTPLGALLAHPLFRKVQSGGDDPVPVADFARLPDGVPVRATVIAPSLRDAYSRSENVPLGAVWLVRRGASVCALSTTCPHAGCFVDFDAARSNFACPCHGSRFALDGSREEGPSPRAMDQLPTEVKEGRVLVYWQRFRTATLDKEPI